ncbi:DUF2254 domain-containing protein [Defluviimonas sp. SAOS-178_SWC]|uniref:DUF2254 domain-containing protein n=1 Tax=Defluviimonas sp. SAOS-178_SWC TaxID=3121287 RepID=UPI0032221C66
MTWRTPFTALLTVPASLALLIGAAGVGLAMAERLYGTPAWLGALDAEAVRTILSVVATSAMTALSLAYSLTLVVFTLAASSIGPRLLKRFTTERANQVTAGLLGGTFLFALAGLGFGGEEPARIAALGAGVLAVASVVQLIWFVRTVAQSVSVDDELAKIAARLERDLKRLRENSEDGGLPAPATFRPLAATAESGYLARLDRKGLVALSEKAGVVLKVERTAGDYLFPDTPVISVSDEVSPDIREKLSATVRQEPARSDAGTVHFSMNLLVEIALRALSPGVNDTFTALAVCDMLSGALAGVSRSTPRLEAIRDTRGNVRVILPGASIEELLDEAYHPLRRAAASNILMAEGLARAYQRLFASGHAGTRRALREHARLLLADLARVGHAETDIGSVSELMPGPAGRTVNS